MYKSSVQWIQNRQFHTNYLMIFTKKSHNISLLRETISILFGLIIRTKLIQRIPKTAQNISLKKRILTGVLKNFPYLFRFFLILLLAYVYCSFNSRLISSTETLTIGELSSFFNTQFFIPDWTINLLHKMQIKLCPQIYIVASLQRSCPA